MRGNFPIKTWSSEKKGSLCSEDNWALRDWWLNCHYRSHLFSPERASSPWTTSCGVARGVPGLGECIWLPVTCSFVCRLPMNHGHSGMIAFGLFMVSGRLGLFLITKMHCLPICQKKAIAHCTETSAVLGLLLFLKWQECEPYKNAVCFLIYWNHCRLEEPFRRTLYH